MDSPPAWGNLEVSGPPKNPAQRHLVLSLPESIQERDSGLRHGTSLVGAWGDSRPGQGQPDTLAPELIPPPIMSQSICAQRGEGEPATLEENGAGLRPVCPSHHSPPLGDQPGPLMLSLPVRL